MEAKLTVTIDYKGKDGETFRSKIVFPPERATPSYVNNIRKLIVNAHA